MEERRGLPLVGRLVRPFALAVVAIATVALAGWFADSRVLSGIRPHYIPMAPNTAICFVLLGLSLVFIASSRDHGRMVSRVGAIVVAVVAVSRLLEYGTDVNLGVDAWFLHFPAESLGLAPVGQMALFTSISLIFAALALFLLTLPERSRGLNDAARMLAVMVSSVGLVFVLGYVYGAPLLYKGATIPMALNTALSFLLLGMGTVFQGSLREIAGRREGREALQRAHDELQAAHRELESFSYSVSHDLRAPLRSIKGFSQILTEDYGDRLDDTGRGVLDRVCAATDRMAVLIDDLLKLSRASRGEMQHEAVDLGGLARTIVAHLRDEQPEREVEIEIASHLAVEGDARLLGVALENLIGNAWKFTARTARPRIEVGVLRDRANGSADGRHTYFVRDNGAGFDMAYADKLFGAFQRLHATSQFEGTGIGLATVQRIIHRHGGRTWAEGAVDRGATFFFTL